MNIPDTVSTAMKEAQQAWGKLLAVGKDNQAKWSSEQREVLDLLAQLVDKSLVLAEQQRGAVRYWLLETVRQYARDRLLAAGETIAVRRCHLEWCRELVQRAYAQGLHQTECLERLDRELDNIRTALEMALASEPVAALELAAGLGRFWLVRHWTEGRAFLDGW